MLDARRFRGEDERWGRSASPLMIARREKEKGDWLLAWFSTEAAVSSPPPSAASGERSAYAEAGDEGADSGPKREGLRWSREGRPAAEKPDWDWRESSKWAEKERAGSSSGSEEGSSVSEEGDDAGEGSSSWRSGREIFLFLVEDVLTASCSCSSGFFVFSLNSASSLFLLFFSSPTRIDLRANDRMVDCVRPEVVVRGR
jgi:hypothetical protein